MSAIHAVREMQSAVKSCARCVGVTVLLLLLSAVLLLKYAQDWSEAPVQRFRSSDAGVEPGPPSLAGSSGTLPGPGHSAVAELQQEVVATPPAKAPQAVEPPSVTVPPAAAEGWPTRLTVWTPLSVEPLCRRFGWRPRPSSTHKPRIFYGLQASGQADVLELHIDEIYPLAYRISIIEVDRLNDGTPRDEPLDFSHPRFQRFADKVRARHVSYNDVAVEAKKMQQTERMSWTYATERVQREWLKHGFRGGDGKMEPVPGDVIMVADGDEIPTREVMQALVDCDVTHFVESRKQIAAGRNPCRDKGGKVKVLMRTQVFQSYFDCPVKAPLWWHPDAIMAECILNGEWTMENVRTRGGGVMTGPWSGRHVHNFYDDEGLAKKYRHYMHACATYEASCHPEQGFFREMRWRACDPDAPDLGMYWWHMDKRPLNEFVDKKQGRMLPDQLPPGLGFALVDQQRPESLKKFFWSTYGQDHNGPWVGKYKGNGTHQFLK